MVSQMLSCLLIILTAVSGGTIVYVYSSGRLGSTPEYRISGLGTANVIVEYYNWHDTGKLEFVLRNIGASPLNVTGIVLNLVELPFIMTRGAMDKNGVRCDVIMPTQACTVFVSTPRLKAGVVYEIIVETPLTIFKYSLLFGTFGAPVSD